MKWLFLGWLTSLITAFATMVIAMMLDLKTTGAAGKVFFGSLLVALAFTFASGIALVKDER